MNRDLPHQGCQLAHQEQSHHRFSWVPNYGIINELTVGHENIVVASEQISLKTFRRKNSVLWRSLFSKMHLEYVEMALSLVAWQAALICLVLRSRHQAYASWVLYGVEKGISDANVLD